MKPGKAVTLALQSVHSGGLWEETHEACLPKVFEAAANSTRQGPFLKVPWPITPRALTHDEKRLIGISVQKRWGMVFGVSL